MELSTRIDVEAPVEQVWAVPREVERWPEWAPTVTSVRRLDDGPLAVGSRVRVEQPRIPPTEYVVTELEAAPVEDPSEFGADGRLNPRAVVAALEHILPAQRSVVMDGGHFMGWAPMYLSVPDPQALVLVGTAFQTIGLGFGSAAGVSVARPERTTVFVTGDGGG